MSGYRRSSTRPGESLCVTSIDAAPKRPSRSLLTCWRWLISVAELFDLRRRVWRWCLKRRESLDLQLSCRMTRLRDSRGARLLPELCADKVPDAIAGRPEGLRLLASALSEESPGGRAREFYRLIEAAFGDGIGALKIPLHEFLKTSPYAMKFTKKEIDRWVAMRGATMHGDRHVAPDTAIAPYLDRLEWAAYDLVLHKENWGMKDPARRPGLAILSGPGADGSVVTFYPSATIPVEFMDPFGVYVIDRRVQANADGRGVLTILARA